jgi:hypothetical protein
MQLFFEKQYPFANAQLLRENKNKNRKKKIWKRMAAAK